MGNAARRIRFVIVGLIFTSLGAIAGDEAAFADYRSEVLTDAPYKYHRMDETVGAVPDGTLMVNEVPNASLGFHNAIPTNQMNQVGAITAMSPNRAVQYFNTGEVAGHSYSELPPDPLADFSLEFWVKTTMTTAATGQWYLGQGLVDSEFSGVANDFGTSMMAGGKVAFGLGNPDTTITSVKSINNGAWHHVVATRTGASMKLYIDGQIDVSGNSGPTGVRNESYGNVAISDIDGPAANGLNGYMDEVAIYTDDLSADAVARHFAAAGAVTVPPPVPDLGVTVYIHGGLGSGNIRGDDGSDCPTINCGRRIAQGSTVIYSAFPAKGSRFGGFDGTDCQTLTALSCRMVADTLLGETVFARFIKAPKTLGGDMFDTFNKDANALESALDNSVNPKSRKAIDVEPVKLGRCACEIGDLAGIVAVSIPKNQVKLVGQDGASLVGQDGASFISDAGGGLRPVASSLKGTSSLLGTGKSGLVGQDGASLVGQDGASLVGQDGASLVGQDGASVSAKVKSFVYAVGSYGADVKKGGNISVTFKPTKSGKKILTTFGQQNAQLKKLGKQPLALNAMYVEAIKPSDGKGTGGTYRKLKIK